MNEEGFLL